MNLLLVGMNHRTAPVEVRERINIHESRQAEALSNLVHRRGLVEGMILSTCNRVEVITNGEEGLEVAPLIRQFLRDYHHCDLTPWERYFYWHRQEDAVRHLFRVASSLDSMIVGEPQILGQVKRAYATARQAGALGGTLSDVVNPHWLLLALAVLLLWTAWQVVRSRQVPVRERGATPGWHYAAVGLVAGFVSGLLGVGGGIVMVPAFTTLLGMPLKRALGTSLVVISALVVPGTIVHWALGHIDWAIFLALAAGVVPGALIGARIALGARDRTLRLAVGAFLFAVAVLYGAREIAFVAGSQG